MVEVVSVSESDGGLRWRDWWRRSRVVERGGGGVVVASSGGLASTVVTRSMGQVRIFGVMVGGGVATTGILR
jgi:hypothetical protein